MSRSYDLGKRVGVELNSGIIVIAIPNRTRSYPRPVPGKIPGTLGGKRHELTATTERTKPVWIQGLRALQIQPQQSVEIGSPATVSRRVVGSSRTWRATALLWTLKKIKLSDRLRALELLGERFGQFVDRVERKVE